MARSDQLLMVRSMLVICGTILSLSLPAYGRDIYVLQGATRGSVVGAASLTWTIDTTLYNSGNATAVVGLVDVSNGGVTPGEPDNISIPAHSTASIPRTVLWFPATYAPLWMLHLDVPTEVIVSNVLSIGSVMDPVTRASQFGVTAAPVFNSIVPAGQAQVHLNTFLGSPDEIPARLNIGVYNDSVAVASAHIEVRQHCDDSVIATADVLVQPKTVSQFPPISTREHDCPALGYGTLGGTPGAVYTIVTVNQPSLSFVSAVANNQIPGATVRVVGNN